MSQEPDCPEDRTFSLLARRPYEQVRDHITLHGLHGRQRVEYIKSQHWTTDDYHKETWNRLLNALDYPIKL